MEFLWNGPPYQGSQSYRRKRKTSAPYQDQSEIFSATSKTNSTRFPKSTRTIFFGERSFTKPGFGPNPGLYKGPTVGASADEDLEPTEDVERSAPEGGS